jgi:hypothetical protein
MIHCTDFLQIEIENAELYRYDGEVRSTGGGRGD